jgi:hypothetical protein
VNGVSREESISPCMRAALGTGSMSEWGVNRPEPSIGAENIAKRWTTADISGFIGTGRSYFQISCFSRSVPAAIAPAGRSRTHAISSERECRTPARTPEPQQGDKS